MQRVIGIKFQEWSRVRSFDPGDLELNQLDSVIVESDEGLGFGTVKTSPSNLQEKDSVSIMKKVVRKATEEDLMQVARNKEKEEEARDICRQKIENMGLQMKLVYAEYLFDGSKAIFYFTAEERVDFRELVRELAGRIHTRIEMRQIGVRDEARMKCGIGPCGRLFCCSTWINSFEPVNVKMAKKQGLSLNPSNISGLCGRLMCCLAFEHQNYVNGVIPKPSCEECGSEKGSAMPHREAATLPATAVAMPVAGSSKRGEKASAPPSRTRENEKERDKPRRKRRRGRKKKQ